MSNCDNTGSSSGNCGVLGHPLDAHTRKGDLLYCNYKWIELGPKGEYWKIKTCSAVCYPQELSGIDGPRTVGVIDSRPIVIYRTSNLVHKVYSMEIGLIGNGTYVLNYKRTSGEIKSLSVSSGNNNYIDVLAGNSFVTIQIIKCDGLVTVSAKIKLLT